LEKLISWNSIKWVAAALVLFICLLGSGVILFFNLVTAPTRLIAEGDQAFWRSRFVNAEQSYQRALDASRQSSQQAKAYTRLCRLYLYQLQYSQALLNCQSAVDINSSSSEAEAQLAYTFLHLGALETAINHGQRALKLDSSNSSAAGYVAEILAEMERAAGSTDYAQSLSIAQYAVEQDPANPEAQRILGYIFELQGDTIQAAAAYQQAVLLVPGFYAFYIDLGDAESSLGNVAAAFNAYNFALMLNPDCESALRGRGWIWLAVENPYQAKLDFNKALRLDSTDASAWSGMGWSLLGEDARDDARRSFEQALALDANNLKAQEGLGNLDVYAQIETGTAGDIQTIPEAAIKTEVISDKVSFRQAIAAAVQVYAFNNSLEITNICSGVIISPDGYILTNAHCIGDSKSQVLLNNLGVVGIGYLVDAKKSPEHIYRAKVLEVDYKLDAALLKINADWTGNVLTKELTLPYVTIGDSEKLQAGDPVWSIGFPGMGGETLTITQGVASGFAERDGSSWIKTDLMTGPGSSGGMVVNEQGELIGLHTQSWADQGESSSRLSAERPINDLRHLWENLLSP
jgi:S1-C subfamily serine protease